MTRLVSRVYEMAEAPAPFGQEAERRNQAARAEAWHVHGLVVLDPADIDDDWLRQAVISETIRRYGRRKATA